MLKIDGAFGQSVKAYLLTLIGPSDPYPPPSKPR
jgi:hypothetical protein